MTRRQTYTVILTGKTYGIWRILKGFGFAWDTLLGGWVKSDATNSQRLLFRRNVKKGTWKEVKMEVLGE